jgi:hypothetical protein
VEIEKESKELWADLKTATESGQVAEEFGLVCMKL